MWDYLNSSVNKSFTFYMGNFAIVRRPHLKFKFMTPNRVKLIVKTCIQLKISPDVFKQTMIGVRRELIPTGFPK